MIAPRLVRIIETHSDRLALGLIEKLAAHPLFTDLRKVPPDEVRQRAHDVYRNLSDWLLKKTESDIERTYTAIGARRAEQGVCLSHLVGAILLTKEHLWAFVKGEVSPERPEELCQELDLLQAVDHFFDRAAFYAARGYEAARSLRGV